ncbi:hypothetical protein WISP_149980 [Willisornis vidua]|uniref:Uncharacterized protein n=1 Tax=Willisornis vidua TaxID=1566151 RepID=A0ABQ9CKU2_9PASS|nr:hypothetical protein WISP_149980 [Willisornis vidua]
MAYLECRMDRRVAPSAGPARDPGAPGDSPVVPTAGTSSPQAVRGGEGSPQACRTLVCLKLMANEPLEKLGFKDLIKEKSDEKPNKS